MLSSLPSPLPQVLASCDSLGSQSFRRLDLGTIQKCQGQWEPDPVQRAETSCLRRRRPEAKSKLTHSLSDETQAASLSVEEGLPQPASISGCNAKKSPDSKRPKQTRCSIFFEGDGSGNGLDTCPLSCSQPRMKLLNRILLVYINLHNSGFHGDISITCT